MDTLSNVLLAFGFAAFVMLVVLPVAAVFLLTLFDIIFRVDMGIGKLIWAAAVLFVPVMGLVLYWLFRPKDYNPLLETEPVFAATPRQATAVITPLRIAPTPPQRAMTAPEEEEVVRRAA